MGDWVRYPGSLYYVSRGVWRGGGLKWAYEKRIGFVSFWLIRWIHGEAKLKELATTINIQIPPHLRYVDLEDFCANYQQERKSNEPR